MTRTPPALESLLPQPEDLAFATDLYQLTMMAAYRARGLDGDATFELFVRRLPRSRGFLVAAGLEQGLSYLRDLRFTDAQVAWLRELPAFGHIGDEFFTWLRDFRFEGTVHAVLEGTVLFPNEPLVRVRAPIAQAQLVETYLLATLNAQTLIASKAARVRIAAGDARVVDFGARRAHGFGAAMLATRAAWIAGLDGTSNVLAAQRLKIPVLGTAAHAYIMSFEREEDAFAHYHALYPDHCTLLVDTYDTREGCRRACAVGAGLKGVRLDSGDMAQLARDCRVILDDAGLVDTQIVASGDLNEHKIAAFREAGVPIDSYGVGTELVTSRDDPTIGGVYKLVERHEDGRTIPVMKLAEGKVSWPGAKQVWRQLDSFGKIVRDVIELEDAEPPRVPDGGSQEPLLFEVMKNGALTADAPLLDLSEARRRCARGLQSLPDNLRLLHDYPAPPTEVGPALRELTETLRTQIEDRS